MKHISILGSTGSIGTQTLDIVRNFPDEFKIVGLTANKNSELLLKQIKEFKPNLFKKTNRIIESINLIEKVNQSLLSI